MTQHKPESHPFDNKIIPLSLSGPLLALISVLWPLYLIAVFHLSGKSSSVCYCTSPRWKDYDVSIKSGIWNASHLRHGPVPKTKTTSGLGKKTTVSLFKRCIFLLVWEVSWYVNRCGIFPTHTTQGHFGEHTDIHCWLVWRWNGFCTLPLGVNAPLIYKYVCKDKRHFAFISNFSTFARLSPL